MAIDTRKEIKATGILLREHRRFHDKVGCPGGADCRVCCAEAAYATLTKSRDCPTCEGLGEIILSEYPTANGEHTPAVCIECGGRGAVNG